MSIVAFTGLPGSGKSYSAVETVLFPALEKGRTVVTNIPLKLGRISDDFPSANIVTFDSKCDVDFFTASNMYPGAVYVIDEAWRWWSSGTKANQIADDNKQFFTEHRHFVGEDGFTTEIVLVTQDLNQVASFVKNLVEETYRCSKLTSLGQTNKYRCDVYAGLAEGQKPRGEPVRQFYGKYSESVYQYYQSHSQNKTGYSTGNEDKQGKSSNILKSPKFFVILIAGPLLFVFSFYYAWNNAFSWGESDPLNQSGPGSSSDRRSSAGSPGGSPAGSSSSDEPISDRIEFKGGKPDELPRSGSDVLHSKARIVGEFGREYLIELPDGETEAFDKRRCTYLESGDPVCLLDDRAVTRYSGSDIPEPDLAYLNDDSSGSESGSSSDESAADSEEIAF